MLELYEKAACMRVNGSVMLWANLIEGQYPDYEGVVPAAWSGCVTISKSVLGSAVCAPAGLVERLPGRARLPDGRRWRVMVLSGGRCR